jgi:reversibly glycosylated polypeptide / UDP-arabinopyranose mutase
MIAIVIPTIRPESYKRFEKGWKDLIKKHHAELVTVWDGNKPKLKHGGYLYSAEDVLGKDANLIYNLNDGVRNLGFAFVARFLDSKMIITLDDDTLPLGDTVQDHIDTLDKKVPITWFTTASHFMRGFPYAVREEAEVVLSHGVWEGFKDWDAPTQLVKGNRDVEFYKGPIPKGVYYPMCGMNIAFKRKLLPYMYYAPMGHRVGLDRFADIWLGIESKKVIDKKGWAVYSGGAKVRHERASNVWKNLQKEARGLEMNENYGVDDYFKLYKEKREKWEGVIKKWLKY